ncbi:HEAT repeat domain-containing protein [bacterium]|nr:HEAT repeat domain-containing protein [bacterium]
MRIKNSLRFGLCLVLCLWTVSRAVTLDNLLDSAAAEPVLYGRPERCDSLVAHISAYPPDSLIGRLGTPWATYYEILRRALVRQGVTARAALLLRLRSNAAIREALPLLPVLEELGRAGDDKYLWPLLKSGDTSMQIAALRCLARFGQPGKSWARLTRLMTSRVAQVRLAAVWCAGELLRRDPQAHAPRRLVQTLRGLLDDPLPQVRFTADETLRLAWPQAAGSLTGPLTSARPGTKK